MGDSYKHSEITELIINAYYTVYNRLGYGFLENIYERAMIIELIKLGLKCEQQKNVKVYYDGMEIGDYFADVVVEDRVILELKAVERIAPEHGVQLVNYLKATKIEIGLLLNFGPKAEIRRKIYSNNYLRNQI